MTSLYPLLSNHLRLFFSFNKTYQQWQQQVGGSFLKSFYKSLVESISDKFITISHPRYMQVSIHGNIWQQELRAVICEVKFHKKTLSEI